MQANVSSWIRAVFCAAALAIAGHAHAAPPVDPLSRLRLLPPTVFADELSSSEELQVPARRARYPGWSLEERMKHHKVEAVSVAVVRDHKIAWVAAVGLADREEGVRATPDTLFQAGSISKPVAAAGVLRKAQEGALALDADVNGYLRSWKLPENEWTAKRKVSFDLLLSHGAGLTVHGFPGYAPGEEVPSIPQVLEGVAPANTAAVRVDLQPGTKWRYSGGGYTIAQLAMQDRFSTPFPRLMDELVLRPSGMTKSTYEQPLPVARLARAAAGYRRDGSPVAGKRHTYPEMAAAGLWTTAGDLARFGIAIQRSLEGAKGALLTKEMAARMVTPFTGDFGLGFEVEEHGGEAFFGHGGADEGFQAYLIMSRRGGHGIAVMTNSDNGIRLAMEIVRGLAREHAWKGYLPEPLKVVPLAAEKLEALRGRYQLGSDDALRLEPRAGRLLLVEAGRPEVELRPIGDGLFACRDNDVRYQVETADGAVSGLTQVRGKERRPATRMAGDATLPSDHLHAGRLDEAAAAYRALFKAKPDDPAIAEGRLNNLGYRLAGEKEYSKAIAVLRLNTELYPSSSNTYDSLGEVYEMAGEKERALASYRRLLEVLPADTKTPGSVKEQLRKNAESRLKGASASD